jgi:Domain of unknown function (DUF6933)
VITIRCTERVRKRFKLRAEAAGAAPSSVLGDWYANLLNHGPERFVVLVSERTLLPLIMPARKSEFPAKVGEYLGEILKEFGVPTQAIAAEVEATSSYVIGPTQNRQVVGVLNEFIAMATFHIPEESAFLTSLKLSETPLGPFRYESADQRTCDAFGLPRKTRWWWTGLPLGPHVS